ncbi:MAG: polysaccharide pyruvyl transferase family protein, partial [Actinomycetota bacterium]
ADTDLNRAEFDAIRIARTRFENVTVFLQGEEVAMQRLLMARKWHAEYSGRMQPVPGQHLHRLERRPLDASALRREVHDMFDAHADAELVDWVIENSFFSWDISEMIGRYRQMDFMFGCRLHGNLLALANGTPAFYLTYDERTREIAELFELPHCDLAHFGPEVDLMASDFAPAKAAYAQRYEDMVRFLDANRLDHRLQQAPALQPAAP